MNSQTTAVGDGESMVVLSEHGGVALLRLGGPGEKIVVLTERRMDALAKTLSAIAKRTDLLGLVIAGPEGGAFCAGADISVIRDIASAEQGTALARRGQEVFSLIASLGIVTVAAIRGACVGGGCELALACTHRVLLGSRDTKIGLPEVKLGILPGFGGTQRLPRLVGIRKAFELMLKGRLLSADEARRIGLASHIVPEHEATSIETVAIEIAAGKRRLTAPKLKTVDSLLTFTRIGRKLVRKAAESAVRQETKGFYPAPFRILEIACAGLELGITRGLELEARALGELVITEECKSLVHIFRISESASKIGKLLADEAAALPATVIGAGVMGAGIASCFLLKGNRVTLSDANPDALVRGKEHIRRGIDSRRGLSDEKKASLLQLLSTETSSSEANTTATSIDERIVIEAVVENIDVKKQVLGGAANRITEGSILATNTSSLSVTEIAELLDHPSRVLGLHFFNPAEKMPLVEVVRAKQTDERSILLAAAVATHVGKYPIVVEDVPGFLVNRILTPYLAEAGTLLSQGLAMGVIDRAALQFGMPMGPIRLLDEVGLDVAAKVAVVIEHGYGLRMQGPNFAEQLVAAQRLGRKNGKGFYLYDGKKEINDPEVKGLLQLPSAPDARLRDEDTLDRLLLPMINEAVRCLDEGVAGATGIEAACQIDLGSVMGFGFPPFRGGVLRYAESRGAETLLKRLNDFVLRYGSRFQPADGIVARAASGTSFYQPVPSDEG